MAKKQRHIKGRVYKTNDSLFSKDAFSKQGRRIVARNDDVERMEVSKIKSLYDSNGKKRKGLIPIDKYPDIPKESGIEKWLYKKTARGEPIVESKLIKTKTRLSKKDMDKLKKKRP